MVVAPQEGHHRALTLKLSRPARKPTSNAATTAAMNTANTSKDSSCIACGGPSGLFTSDRRRYLPAAAPGMLSYILRSPELRTQDMRSQLRCPLPLACSGVRKTGRLTIKSGAKGMDLPARRQPPTVRLRRLAAELRNLRQAAGLTREDAAEQTNINSATLYRIETAKARPQRRTLLTLLDKYGVTDPARRTALVELSKQATQLGWLQAYESELPEEYTTYISFESEARSVRNYESLFVPGLLQTEGYTRAVVTA